jgi:hypothetical protein
MALFQSYAPPGVYTSVVLAPTSAPLFGTARIPVLIGEGVENFVFSDQEIFRGSSASADDQSVNEDISAQATGLTRTFQVTYFPITTGDGSGTVTNDYTKIQVTSNGIPVTVVSLNGTLGSFQTQQIIPAGAVLLVTYFFKRSDTHKVNEDLSAQIPSFASLTYTPAVGHSIVIGINTPGKLGNLVNVTFTLSTSPVNGKSDVTAVTGAGTANISIELLKADNVSVRTLTDISNLIAAGIPTSQGYLTGSSIDTTVGVANTAAFLSGGAGPSTNTVFKTHFTPIVDGTNGGVVTTNTADVQVKVNGVAATVTTVDGAHGLVTLATGVTFGSTLTVTYYTNNWQNTFDLLPANNIVQIDRVGLGPGRADYINGVDYVLANNKIYWGAAAVTSIGKQTAGFTPLSATQITTTLVDENVYMVPATGVADGVNAVFTSAFTPVDGSGLAKVTDDPSKILVYVGIDPASAQAAGAVTVSRLVGATGVITLYNPPAASSKVYVSGYRTILNDHTFTLSVVNANTPGQGTYSVVSETGSSIIKVTGTAAGSTGTSVTDGSFATTGIVWPFSFPDIEGGIGGPDETLTLTFQQDGHTRIVTPATQATASVAQTGSDSLLFTATTTGTGPNATTSITMVGNGTQPILPAYTVYTSAGTFSGSTGVATAFASWQSNHAYVAGQIIITGTSIQVVTVAGTSGGTIPGGFSATAGVTTSDSGVTWTSNGLAPTTVEQVFVNISATTGALTLSGIINLFTGVTGFSGNIVTTPLAGQILASLGAGITTDLSIAHALVAFSSGTAQVTAAIANRYVVSSSRTSTQTAADGLGRTGNATTPAYVNAASKLWAALTAFSTNDTVVDTNGNIQKVIVPGTSGAAAPTWGSAGNTVDGSVSPYTAITWQFVGPVFGLSSYLGETYLDPNTAVKFTIVDPRNALPYGYTTLPSPAYSFAPGDKITFLLEDSKDSPFVTGVTPVIVLGGLRTSVSTTFGMNPTDTATVATFNKSGSNPNNGQFYYLTFETAKQASDFALQLYTNASDAYKVYGTPNTTNRVSLGISLLTENGAQQFGVIQVPKQTGTPVASDQSFINAIQSLASPLPGSSSFASVIVPLSTSSTVQQFLSRFLITQAAPRIQAEGIGFVGFDQYTTPSAARQAARSFKNSRIIAVAPSVAGILLQATQSTAAATEYAVDGPFLAAALAGLNVNPANDVATTLTNQQVVGFSRLLGTRLDEPTLDLMAADGLTLLVENNGALKVRHYMSTDNSNVLTSEPTSTTVTDYVRQQFRTALDQFIGRKFVGTLVNDVTAVCNSLLRILVNQEIISGYKNLSVVPDPNDPTLLDITVSFKPIFSLLYISVTFTVTTNL